MLNALAPLPGRNSCNRTFRFSPSVDDEEDGQSKALFLALDVEKVQLKHSLNSRENNSMENMRSWKGPRSCHAQGHHPADQVAPKCIQLGLEHFQGWESHRKVMDQHLLPWWWQRMFMGRDDTQHVMMQQLCASCEEGESLPSPRSSMRTTRLQPHSSLSQDVFNPCCVLFHFGSIWIYKKKRYRKRNSRKTDQGRTEGRTYLFLMLVKIQTIWFLLQLQKNKSQDRCVFRTGWHFIFLEWYKLVTWYHGFTLLNNSSHPQSKKHLKRGYQGDTRICIHKDKKRLGGESALSGKVKCRKTFKIWEIYPETSIHRQFFSFNNWTSQVKLFLFLTNTKEWSTAQ